MMTMMKRRQLSPSRQGRSPILPETAQDEDDKKHKSSYYSFAAIKRTLLQSLSSWPPMLAATCALMLCLFVGLSLLLKLSVRSQKRPITIHLNSDDSLYKGVVSLKLTNHPQHLIQADRRNHHWIDHGASWHPLPNEDDPREDDKCVPLGDWQYQHNPLFACSPFHEINLAIPTLKSVGGGTYRDVWAFPEYDGTLQVIKTLVWDSDWDDFVFARKEAMAMAQLSASPYVATIFGACSHSTIMDYSPDGILWWLFDDFQPTKNELLQIAHDVAHGVADAQNVDSQGRATICHMDIKANQFLLVNGTYKLNDFNMCEFLRWDTENEEYCSFHGGYVGRWQAPEQISQGADLQDEKSDVFSLGYVLYFLLTGDQQWHDDSSRNAAKWALKGQRPEIPDEAKESDHPFDVAVIEAIKSCLQQVPRDRPTARQVANFLHDALVKAGLSDKPLEIVDE